MVRYTARPIIFISTRDSKIYNLSLIYFYLGKGDSNEKEKSNRNDVNHCGSFIDFQCLSV